MRRDKKYSMRDSMRKSMGKLRRYVPWFLLILGIDGVSALLLWLADLEAFRVLAPLMLLMTVMLFAVIVFVLQRAEKKKEQALFDFLNSPDEWHEENLLKAAGTSDEAWIRMLGTVLRKRQNECAKAEAETADYEEYVEAWAHEIKTPLSLLTMVLDNQSGELPSPTAFKLDYIRNRIQEQISQMLYYARLKSANKDYLFEFVDLRECMEEVLEDYRMLLEEKQFLIRMEFGDSAPEVYTDRRGILFLLGQIVSNAVKYSSDNPELTVSFEKNTPRGDVLRIRDNGIGVKQCDFPYIFEKGFTGDAAEGRNRATGMGLYLSGKMADDLNIRLEVWSERGVGFEMAMIFPRVNRSDRKGTVPLQCGR